MIDLAAYKKPALQFSGGKDSLACLYLLRDQLDGITVYHVDTGDQCPETAAVVAQVKEWVPHFATVRSDVGGWRQVNGYPTDLVPARAHMLGVAYGMSAFRLSNRFDCCFANLMHPLHARMVADGVDAVIRGTKQCDTGRIPAEGPTDYYDVVLPLRDWSHDDVFAFLERVGAPYNTIYDHYRAVSAPECLGCTAWWDDGKAAYLRAAHPEQFGVYRANLLKIAGVVSGHMADLYRELEGD